MNTLEDETSDFFHMGKYSPLVQLLDAQKGYCLLKNLATYTDKQYSVGVLLDDGTPRLVMDNPDDTWINYEQADEVMRNALNKNSYNKASLDHFNHDDEY